MFLDLGDAVNRCLGVDAFAAISDIPPAASGLSDYASLLRTRGACRQGTHRGRTARRARLAR